MRPSKEGWQIRSYFKEDGGFIACIESDLDKGHWDWQVRRKVDKKDIVSPFFVVQHLNGSSPTVAGAMQSSNRLIETLKELDQAHAEEAE